MVTCHFCKFEVDPKEIGIHQWTAGWVKLRAGGGGHGVSLPQRKPHFAHAHCVEREIGGWGQRDLYDPPEVPAPKPVEPGPTNAAWDQHMLYHVCNVCGGNGLFGVGVEVKAGHLGLWYCREHRPWCEVAT